MNFLKRNFLFFVVFITGACILIIEVVAIRILSPYYGNTIFSVSSVITVILAALSLGYYLGGRLADFRPSFKWFFGIILAGGLSVFLILAFIIFFLPVWGYNFSVISGPLISAVILFFVPSFLLGTLSPFAIKLKNKQTPKEGIGKISGKVFFWSTLGSIFGSLLAGFILIPRFGINQIIVVVGVLLVVLGFVPLIFLGVRRKTIDNFILIIVIFVGTVIFVYKILPQPDILYSRDGVYEKITIYEKEHEGRPARFLLQDRSTSGAMFIGSDEHVYNYSKYYALYKIFNPEIKEILIIGGGTYTVPKVFWKELPEAHIEVVEIEPELFELAQKYFDVPDDPRLKNYIEDGRRFLYDTDKKYDFIFSDAYRSLFSIPTHLTTKEFFELGKEKLKDNGVFMINVIGDLYPEPPSLVFSEMRTFQSVFPNSYFFATDSKDSSASQNIIFVGYLGDRKIDFNDLQIEDKTISELSDKIIDPGKYDLSVYPLLTDNFAPVEYLSAKVIERKLAD